MNLVAGILGASWTVAAQMAPYLLFGFLAAGVLSVLVSPSFVERHLGRRGWRQVVKAAVLGVPLPLCSCSVLPVAASLRRHGASPGATLSFLVSTPQTGVDSILVTHALLGPLFALFRVVVAFVSGIAGGVALEWVTPVEADADGNGKPSCCCAHGEERGKAARILRYGLGTLPREIGRSMLFGIVLSGVLTHFVPQNYFADKLGAGLPAMLAMLLVGIPLYVCSSGSVPIAFALITMGISPGAALVFLVAGPATNAAAVTTVWKVLGRRATVVYLLAISVTALVAGVLLDAVGILPTGAEVAGACHEAVGWAGHAGAAALVVVLLPALLPRREGEEE